MRTSAARQAADQAVARGIEWLEANVPRWRAKIDRETLDLAYRCKCVLGQLDGDFYEAVWRRKLDREQVRAYGLVAAPGMPYSVLTAAWRRALEAE